MAIETITVQLMEPISAREDSLHVQYNGNDTFLPKSHIEKIDSTSPDKATITIPYWLYKDRFE